MCHSRQLAASSQRASRCEHGSLTNDSVFHGAVVISNDMREADSRPYPDIAQYYTPVEPASRTDNGARADGRTRINEGVRRDGCPGRYGLKLNFRFHSIIEHS